MDIRAKLAELGLALPPPPSAVADYVPAKVVGDSVLVSGMLPMRAGELIAAGRAPGDVSIEAAQGAARQCVLNGLAAVDPVIDGDWSRVAGVSRVGVFVASEPGFHEQHKVANGASGLLREVFGDAGRHVRAAVGVTALPLGAVVEVELAFAVRAGTG